MQNHRIGTAGWNIPRQHAAAFPEGGSHLARYAGVFTAVEINSSFHRPHRPTTYARWAAAVPPWFRFAVKLPREISHQRKLVDASAPLERFLGEIAGLGDRLGPVLVQLPPSLAYDAEIAGAFLAGFRARFHGDLVCEPRHASWFCDAADALLAGLRVARVAADPAKVPRAGVPGGWPGLVYRRLHGAPRMYYSAYPPAALDALAQAMRATPAAARGDWCMFDNTTLGEAAGDALALRSRLAGVIL